MELTHLHLRDFRNLRQVELEPGARFNVLAGRNGQGKTNILEAIYLLGAAKSFRAARSADLVRWDTDAAEVVGEVDRAGHKRHIAITVKSGHRKVVVDGMTVRHLADFFGNLGIVVFAPDDLQILKGSPRQRRRFLDRAVFNSRAGYLADVQAYEQVLKQRNALLRDSRGPSTLLEVYDEQLVELGALITERRLGWLEAFADRFADTFAAIFVDDDAPAQLLDAVIGYHAGWFAQSVVWRPHEARIDEAQLRRDLAKALQDARRDDLRRGFTTVGPHRDDLDVQLGGHEARGFASQGQTRALVLAMKIAEIRLLTEKFGFSPVLLLDDVSSELDRRRNQFLFEFLGQQQGQVFITTTHRDHILLDEDVEVFHVCGGEVTRAEAGT